MKRSSLTFLAIMLLSLSASAFSGEVVIDGINYYILTKGQTAEVRSKNYSYSGDIVIPESVEYEGVTCDVVSIGSQAFSSCKITSVAIGSKVKDIGNDAFSSCANLTTVKLGNSVETIGNNAFSECRALTDIVIPNTVKTIGSRAFQSCAFTGINIPNSVTSIDRYAFQNCKNLTTIDIPESILSLNEGLFSGCTSLASVNLPNSVTSIGYVTFGNCSSLVSIKIPNSVTSIGMQAFGFCNGLVEITIPDKVTKIESNTFWDCSSLKTITFGSGVTSIGSALKNCTELTDVYCLSTKLPSAKNSSFDNCHIEYATLHVPEESIEEYKKVEPWNGFKSIVALDGSAPKKCATPTITYSAGKLMFSSETEGAEFVSDIADSDIKKHYVAEVPLTVTYTITAYATKAGLEDSDEATAMLCWIDAAPQTQGMTNSVAEVKACPVLIQNTGGEISIQGVADGTQIAVYDISGMQVGCAVGTNGQARVSTSLQKGSVAIVKIGQESVKMVVK
ncbi:MAG: leucine-rich repeat domain-containing protein [Prevotella sp.]|nr:leucine-rich repeat domain-containing protein [Prevotella sp.]